MFSTFGIWQYIASILAITTVSIVLYLKWIYGYWKRRNIDYIQPSIPLGNMENPLFMKKGFTGVVKDAYSEFKSRGKQFGGIYVINKPMLLVVHPDFVKSILTKDFQYFMNRGTLLDEEREPLTAHLFSLEDERWKNLRHKLTPTFTSGKMKMMLSLITSISDQMIGHLKSSIDDRKCHNIKELTSRYTIDVIGSCVFGLDCNSFKDPDAEFQRYGRKATALTFLNAVRTLAVFIMPEISRLLRVRSMDKDIEIFFTKAFRDVITQRATHDTIRNDFVQLLLEMSASHAGADLKTSLTTEEMIPQAFFFFIAGFETSSSNFALTLYYLAKYPEIQEKVRQEINETLQRHGGEVTYEALMELKYMDQVIDETLRFFPPLPTLTRKCNKDYIIPGTDIKIEKETSVIISILGLQMDEEYFPDPEKFDPERFSKENKAKRHPSVHIPFGYGPRICIGQRFAVLQIKVGLAQVIRNFKVLMNEKTPKSITPDPKRVLVGCPDDLELDFENV